MNLQNKKIKGEKIVIDDGHCFNVIGPSVILEDCTLVCKVPTKSLGIQGKLVNTSIISEKALVRFSWIDSTLIGCNFFGTFIENEFGNIHDPLTGPSKECDFTKAGLIDCDFYGNLIKTNIFPTWPYFVLLDPHQNRQKMSNIVDNSNIADIIDAIEYCDENLRATVYNAACVAKRSSVTQEEIRKFFSQFSFVLM